MLLFLLACCFYLISAPSTSAPVCGSDGSVLLYQTIRLYLYQTIREIWDKVLLLHALLMLIQKRLRLLIKRWVWEQEQKFWATVLKPNKFLLAAPYQVHLGKLLTPTSHRALVIAMLMTQCTVRFSQKIKFIIHSFLLDKGKREAPEWHWIYTSWLKHMI